MILWTCGRVRGPADTSVEEASHHSRRLRDWAALAQFPPCFGSPRDDAVGLARATPARTRVPSGLPLFPILSRPDSDGSCAGGRRFRFDVKYLGDMEALPHRRTPNSAQRTPREQDASLVARALAVESVVTLKSVLINQRSK